MDKNRRVQFNRHFPRDQQPLCSTLPPSECQVVLQHVCIYSYAPHHSWMGVVFLFCFFNYSEVQTRATENKAMHMKWSRCRTHPVYRNGSLLLGTLHKGEKLFWHAGGDKFWRRSPMKSLCGAVATWITIGCNTAFNTSPPELLIDGVIGCKGPITKPLKPVGLPHSSQTCAFSHHNSLCLHF